MSVTLQPGPQAARAARRFVHYAAEQWLGQPPQLTELLTVVTELVDNAASHAHTPMVLGLALRGDHVLVELYDGSLDRPRPDDAPTGDRGLGLRIVDGVAVRWGVSLQGEGKVVWAEV
jgi:anti-sigma regulatory factor (Ser/Thr protein kinase)